MTGLVRRSSFLFALPLAVAALVAACGSNNTNSAFTPTPEGGSPTDGSSSGSSSGSTGSGSGSLLGDASGSSSGGNSDAAAGFDVQPSAMQTVTVTLGQKPPTVVFKAFENGQPVGAGWTVDRGDLAGITMGTSVTGTVSPTGAGGGLVTVTAGRGGATLTRQVFIKVVGTQNGGNPNAPGEGAQIPTTVGQLTSGGGVGGVGGEGLGGGVTDAGTIAALNNPMNNGQAQGLAYLYPYDQTVWARGLLAPLLQWTWSTNDADAIQIRLATTSGSFTWTGNFGRPAILMQTGGAYIRAPIPQDIWTIATNTAGGPTPNKMTDKLTINLVVAKGGQGYGPISETWTVAPGLLDGIIYYNSYGTQLAQNLGGAVGGNGMFGGAVLSIKVGDTGPQLAAGASGTTAQCRVCHSVAAGGSRLVVQHGDSYSTSSAYDLKPTGNVETVMTHDATFPGMYADGSMALTEGGQLLPLPNDATPLTVAGLSSVTTDLGTPAFSPDGKHVVMNPMAGSSTVTTPSQQLWVMDFAFAGGTGTFSNPVLVADYTGQSADSRPGWGAFLSDSKSLVFQHQSQAGADGNGSSLYTRKGELSQIYWTSTANASAVTPLDQLNGKGYAPKLPSPINMSCTGDGVQVGNIDADHSDDVDHNYEPTVNPLAAGGYAWVVFTSRRMYGSVSDIPPFCSDPRGVDLIQNITPKKLWVAAIDLNAAPGKDASHPAFYLPAQELLAGNSRAFWVLEPCRADGSSCTSGDMCCNGYCEAGADGGLVCSNKPPNANCSQQGDKCTSNADCCMSTDSCINGFCEQSMSQ
ncbi:MAG TPA: hypothetical protein VF765_16370 [Polyangiaceae bacterium]